MKSFPLRAFRVAFDDDGGTEVTSSARPGHPVLTRLDIGTLQRAGEPVDGDTEPVQFDDDEIEQHWTAPGLASVVVRHSFVGGWRTRVVLAELSGRPWTASLRLGVQPGPGVRPWSWATGAHGVLALLPDDPAGSVLYVRTGPSPAPVAPRPDGLVLGPYRLAAGERLVTSFEWASARWPREVTARLGSTWPALPRWSTVALDEEIWLPADPDAALVLPDEVGTTDLGDRQALTSAVPGRYRVELRSARGSTELELAWAPPVPEFLSSVAERILAAPSGPAGVVGMPDLACAVVVQRASRILGFPSAIAAADALDQFTARFDDDGPDRALGAIYLIGEYDRLGDPDLIVRATELIARAGTPVPGSGLALIRTAIATVVAGRPPDSGPRLTAVDPGDLAGLEVLLATRPQAAPDNGSPLAAGLHRLGLELLAGLPGRLPDDHPSDDTAYAIAVLRLVPDALNHWWSVRYGLPAAELADARALELVDRLGPDAAVGRAHAWLAVSS